ncbi:MAG: PDZ domain-containing protein [Candidatus Omnitrophica bacterium]|nr:PDZ domain-containing protein [Candidatus Omnitrophota bacterium]
MKTVKSVILILISAACAIIYAADAPADTIITNDGKEIKGIVVEDYRDRVIFSTADGEITVMKSDMRELSFDSDEDNLIKLAEQTLERRDYSRAMSYYDMALKANPDSSAVKQGMAYLRGSFFRKEESLKAADIKRQQDIELYGGQAPEAQKSDETGDMTRMLEKLTGMRIAVVDNMPKIEALRSPSPAYEAGLRRGDILVSVWGKLTGYLSLKEILDLLINKSAIEIRCTIERESDVEINPNKTIISGIEDLIGASFAMEIDGLTVSAVKESGYAAQAGLQKEDLIMAIDGKQTRYMPLKKAVELIRNLKEGAVKLVIRRKTIIWRTNER